MAQHRQELVLAALAFANRLVKLRVVDGGCRAAGQIFDQGDIGRLKSPPRALQATDQRAERTVARNQRRDDQARPVLSSAEIGRVADKFGRNRLGVTAFNRFANRGGEAGANLLDARVRSWMSPFLRADLSRKQRREPQFAVRSRKAPADMHRPATESPPGADWPVWR